MPRDYRTEYQRRIARGLARGLTRSQARGHPKSGERSVQRTPSRADDKINAAIRKMHHGASLSAAARSSNLSTERLRRFVRHEGLAERAGRRWVLSDERLRRVPVLSGGRQHTILVRGFNPASVVGEHHSAAKQFVRTNDRSYLEPFKHVVVRDINGRRFPLETDPNAVHRIAAMDNPPFHEIYEITSQD